MFDQKSSGCVDIFFQGLLPLGFHPGYARFWWGNGIRLSGVDILSARTSEPVTGVTLVTDCPPTGREHSQRREPSHDPQ